MKKKTWRIIWKSWNEDGSCRVRYADCVKYTSREAALNALHELQDDPKNAGESFSIEEPFDEEQFIRAFVNGPFGRCNA